MKLVVISFFFFWGGGGGEKLPFISHLEDESDRNKAVKRFEEHKEVE